MLKLTNYNKNVNIGILARANDEVAVIPRDAPESFERDVREVLQVDVVRANLAGTNLVGVFMAMNNRGAVVGGTVTEEEVQVLRDSGIKVEVVEDRLNALGNLIVATDKGAIAYSGFSQDSLRRISRAFGCHVRAVDKLGGFRTIGSIGVATSRGALFHPELSDEELRIVEKVLKVNVDIGTVNMGIGFVKTGIIANAKGALIGDNTTGPEMLRIEEALGFLR